MNACRCLVLVITLFGSPLATADSYRDAVVELQLEALAGTLTPARITALLDGHGGELSAAQREAAAILISAGVLAAPDLTDPARVAQKTSRFTAALRSDRPSFIGRIEDASMPAAIGPRETHDELLSAQAFLAGLGELLAEDVLTGYDLRRIGVYDDVPESHGFVYSHSSWRHLRQLVALLRRERVEGWVYITPKVSAFLYREGWGGDGANLATLATGQRIIQAREFAVLFEFDDPNDRARFHELITRYAKKDADDEQGLLADSWWQPFYYTDGPLDGFEKISLVVVSSGQHEATLTVLEENTQRVVAALGRYPWTVRVDTVWVNPPFKRFLEGGYK